MQSVPWSAGRIHIDKPETAPAPNRRGRRDFGRSLPGDIAAPRPAALAVGPFGPKRGPFPRLSAQGSYGRLRRNTIRRSVSQRGARFEPPLFPSIPKRRECLFYGGTEEWRRAFALLHGPAEPPCAVAVPPERSHVCHKGRFCPPDRLFLFVFSATKIKMPKRRPLQFVFSINRVYHKK